MIGTVPASPGEPANGPNPHPWALSLAQLGQGTLFPSNKHRMRKAAKSLARGPTAVSNAISGRGWGGHHISGTQTDPQTFLLGAARQ